MKVIGVFDMKKIVISNIVILALLISSICLAFEHPVSGNWIFIAGDEQVETWINADMLNFHRNEDFYSSCNNHIIADVVSLTHSDYETPELVYLALTRFDLNCATGKGVLMEVYDLDTNELVDSKRGMNNFHAVIPGTIESMIMEEARSLGRNRGYW